MKKIAITTTSFGEYDKTPLNNLRSAGLDVILNPFGRKLTKKETVEICRDAIGIIAGTEILDAAVLKELRYLQVISRCGTGLDNIDLNAAGRIGIVVFNTPNSPTLAVAELTVGLILNLLRQVSLMDRELHIGVWQKRMGNLLSGKKVGIIGFGRIGRKVSKLLSPFNCEINYYDIRKDIERENWVCRIEFNKLLEISDIITIHISSGDKVLGRDEIRLMKKGSWLINVSRSFAVVENALYKAIKEGHLSGAAIDVFEQEPYNGSLRELDKVILTPHIGSYAKESRIEMETEAVKNLLNGLRS
ncbi:MAG: hydroxyacid dehydrogenase [Planctomycetes bacterium RIFCSPLOWO2_12_FULL_39_13]|nr:MAG: hydroxyacid dehydrogenase [Planctomycetes bacterium GWA2_39_15]OHB99670.1 MAG: hydroxyacid dehydrogenase [Planctomycetes bacterium RIFCSPLOWO2_12_FULL_39_13]